MANRPAFYTDVIFDAAAADAAVDALRRIRHAVHSLGEVRAEAASEATSEWRGRFRDEFDLDLAASQRDLASIEARLEAATVEIRAGQEEAEREQALRLRQRAEYEAAERRRLELERNPPDVLDVLGLSPEPPTKRPVGIYLR